MTETSTPRGRPQAASRELLQDAALELFLENGYAGTTIEQITTRAGVSRNTFFNYFDAKSDVFWVELDDALERIPASLSTAPPTAGGMQAVEAALLEFGGQFGPGRVPFALTQYELVGSVNELQASALTRFTRQAALLADFLTSRGFERLRAQTASYAALGAVVAAGQAWADAGTARGDLLPYLSAALSPVIGAFADE
ncbi:TetR/AcrR family transcriptional regulator [Cryobacterium sp. BB307]|uniref:TetR/AcrR family transcriptional regulator n=1 Tax=Cryobacterium sp. BB307 TaxID=2716317 RepID=UPI001446A1F8|nr:TetR/AcrR family transcriptional regulator [Cryobacterium sp. BB307]